MPSLRSLSRTVALLRRRLTPATPARASGWLEAARRDPARLLADAGIGPDPWQQALLRGAAGRVLLLCCRQSGKSTAAAALALREALLRPGALVLLLSPTLRQSAELYGDKVVRLYNALGRPVEADLESALRMGLANGSRIVSLPGDEKSIRGYSGVALLIVDEAARVPDELYYSVRPMLAVSRGKLVALSTPFGKRGWFFEEWRGPNPWERVRLTAPECPRITAAFLAEEEKALGPRWYRQEYHCSFEDTTDSVFAWEDVQAALSPDVRAWAWPGGKP
jgi:hypothetical protein